MSDTALMYELPAPDAELDALVGISIEAAADEDALPVGTIVEATVIAVDEDSVQLSAKGTLIHVPLEDAKAFGEDAPALQSTHSVLVEEERAEGGWRGSIDKARQLARYEKLRELSAVREAVQATILVARRSGFSLDINGFRAFLPNDESGIPRESAFEAIGQAVPVEITGIDDKNLELLASRKRFVEAERQQAFQEIASRLNIMDVIEGTVTSTMRYGAFVDIGGIEGLLHISEMSLDRVEANALPIQVGDTLRVQVVQIDEERQRIGLSRKEVLLAEQRAKLEALEINSLVEGRVDGLTDFGAFVEFGDGFRGLCHISELSWTERVESSSSVLKVGEVHTFRVLQVDPAAGRISLSLRQAVDNPWSRFIDSTPIGTQLDVRIVAVEERGLVVQVNDDLQGFIRLSDLSWTIRAEKPSDVRDFEVGETLPASLLLVEPQRQRLLLGLKQIEGDPWDEAGDVVKDGHVFKAVVDRFTDNAAFLQVVPGLDARLHISEVSVERVESLRAALRLGEEIEVMTIHADRARRRLDVSIKAIEARRLAEQPRGYAEEASMGGLADALRDSGLISGESSKDE